MPEPIELKHCFYCKFNLTYSEIWFFAHDKCFCSEKCRKYFMVDNNRIRDINYR